jgi:hypothetical protein
VLDSNGNVGIGTISPTNKLEVDGGSSSTRLRVSTTNTGVAVAGLILSNSSKSAFNDGIEIVHGAGVTKFNDLAGEDQLVIDMTNSRIGIGNSSPQRELHIGAADNTNHDAVIVLNNGGALGYRAGVEWRYEGVTSPRARISVNASYQDLEFDTAGTKRMTIDSAGRVTTPYQPYFYAYSSDVNVSYSQGTKLNYNLLYEEQGGSNYSTTERRFTAPVTGIYSFTCYAYGNSADNHGIEYRVNGSTRVRGQVRDGTGDGYIPVAMVIKLTAGDYVEVFASGVGVTNFYGGSTLIYSQFSGCLIG